MNTNKNRKMNLFLKIAMFLFIVQMGSIAFLKNAKAEEINHVDIYGMTTSADGWIYYSSSQQNVEKNGAYSICKMKLDGSQKTTLINDYSNNTSLFPTMYYGLNIDNDWIYYIKNNDDSKTSICRMKIDGSQQATLLTGGNNELGRYNSFKVVDDWIYYSDGEHSIYKMKTDGSQQTTLVSNNSSFYYSLDIQGDWIYYSNDDRNNLSYSICKMKLDGSQQQELCIKYKNTYSDQGPLNFTIINDFIYYYSYYGSNIMKMKTDGSQQTTLLNSNYNSILKVTNDWIYYIDNTNNISSICKMKLDGSQQTLLLNGTYYISNIFDNWFYYYKTFDDIENINVL